MTGPMTGQRVGYRRVSSLDQNTERQLHDVQLDRCFEDHCSGKDTERPQLKACLQFCRAGDVLVVHSMDRLARNLVDLCTMVKELNTRGVAVEFNKEHLVFDGTDNPMATLQLQIMGSCAEFERAMIRQRQAEGIALRKAKGLYKGRAPSLTAAQAEELVSRVTLGATSKGDLAEEYKISRQTLYRYVHEAKLKDLEKRTS